MTNETLNPLFEISTVEELEPKIAPSGSLGIDDD